MELAKATDDEKLWAALSHGLTFLGWMILVGNILPPLIIYVAKKDSSPFVAEHARESLNFQISILIYTLCAFLLMITIVLIPLSFIFFSVVGVFDLVCVIIAIIKATNGEMFRYPCSLRLVK
jgi:uncharacterized protein